MQCQLLRQTISKMFIAAATEALQAPVSCQGRQAMDRKREGRENFREGWNFSMGWTRGRVDPGGIGVH